MARSRSSFFEGPYAKHEGCTWFLVGRRYTEQRDLLLSRSGNAAAAIHDVGKISVPSEILSKPGRLLDIEFSLVKAHAEEGYNILRKVDFPRRIAEIVHQHHERLDGSGYPQGLKGDEILLEAKIVSAADTVEAMGSHRPYRPSLGIGAALRHVEEGKGILFESARTRRSRPGDMFPWTASSCFSKRISGGDLLSHG